MMKKAIALLLVVVMSIGMLAGCGSSDVDTEETVTEEPAAKEETTTEEAAAEETTEEAAEEEIPENTITGDENVEDPFYVYSWNTEIGDRLEYFKEAYPEYADRIIYVNTGGSDYYQSKLDAIITDPSNKQYPDLIGLEADYIKKYVDSEYTLSVEDLGITSADYANQYEYTVKIPMDSNGNVKALSWQAAPGAMMYRRSLAEKYLGTQEPEEVQEFFKDWDTMLDTARKINKDSNGETKLFSGNDDVFRVYMATREKPWITDDVLTIDDQMLDYMDFNKSLEEEDLTNKTAQWDDAWNAGMSNDSTFAYMGCTWFLQWSLKSNAGGETVGEGTYGDWAMCRGPEEYYWGGTWLGATKECSDPELAGLILKFMTCDTDNMKKICVETLDYVNNKEAVKELIAEGEGNFDFIGGQNFLKMFSELADNVDVSTMTGEDMSINSAFSVQVDEYSLGNKTKEEALADFKAAVTDTFSYISAE